MANLSSEFIGSLFFSGNTGTGKVCEKPINEVREAAQTAGLDADLVSDVRDRSAFIRCIGGLKKSGAIEQGSAKNLLKHKLTDDDNEIVFQFSRVFLESEGAEYDKAAVVRFSKSTGQIACSNLKIQELAQNLYDQAHQIYSVSDLHRLTERIVSSAARRVIFRDGVHVIPYQHQEVLDKLQRFYTLLGFTFVVVPLGRNPGNSKALLQSVVDDIRESVKTVQTEISELQGQGASGQDQPGLTKCVAKNRLADLQVSLKNYQAWAKSLKMDTASLFAEAGEASTALVQAAMPVESLIQHVQNGGKLNKLVYDLFAADDDHAGAVQALEAAQKAGRSVAAVELPETQVQDILFENKAVVKGATVDLVR